MAPLDVLRPSQDTFDRIAGGPMLLSVQAALGVMLLVGALAILPSVLRALLAPPGVDATDLFMVGVSTANDETAWDAREQTRRGLAALEVVRQMPGVVDAALSQRDPFWPSGVETQVARGVLRNRSGFEGRVLPVDGDFFRTLAIPMKAGQALSHAEVEEQALVAVVNESAARALWPGLPAADVVGRMVTTLDGPRRVVGVAADFRVGLEAPSLWAPDDGGDRSRRAANIRLGIDAPTEPTLFLPLSANEAYAPVGSAFPWNEYQVVIRMADGRVPDRVLLSDRLREQPWMKDRANWSGVFPPRSVAAKLDVAFEKPRLLALIFGTLAGIALLLTVLAMYGLANFEIGRSQEEMTVRLALGATPRALRGRLAVVIVKPVLAGILAGLPMSWILATLLSTSVSVGNANEVWIYAVASAAMLVAALTAAWLPGRHLFTMRPSELLRSS